MKKIDLYADGLKINEFDENFGLDIDGYTFNPSIFKNHGASNYLDYGKKKIKKSKNKPISLEVFADNDKEMIGQAQILHNLGKNVFVKIPITFTNGDYTLKVLDYLVQNKIKINLTAIFTIQQIERVISTLKDTNTILSIFAGRIYDSGQDAFKIMYEISKFVKNKSKCKVLWASPRMPYDYISAINSGADIITMQGSQIKKLKLFGKDLNEFSLETVKQFHNDAKSSGFKI